MPGPVALVTDSVACLAQDEADLLGIAVVPVHLFIDDEDYHDGELEDTQLYDRISRATSVSSAAPGPGEFIATYEMLAESGYQSVLVATVSAALSNVHNSARLAASETDVDVRVIDTKMIGAGQGLLVRHLAEEARRGVRLDALEAIATDIRSRIGLLAVVPDLEHLARSGRVSRVVGFLGKSVGVKPLIEVRSDGEAHPAGVVRSFERGVSRMVDRVVERCQQPGSRVAVIHVLATDLAASTVQELRSALPAAEVTTSPFTPVMGMYTGPGLIGVAWEAAPADTSTP